MCSSCHQEQYDLWKKSDHALAMQKADEKSVLGNFQNATFRKDGVTSTFFMRNDRYVVTTDGPDGRLHEYPIAYTFGVDPLQQYLVEFDKGRYQALSIAWDTRPASAGGQRWFHLYPKEKIDHQDILHWTGPLQNWNFMCADCHSTNLKKNYRSPDDRFETSFSDINVSCEACHGPGSRHVEWAKDARAPYASESASKGLVVELKDASQGTWSTASGESIAKRIPPLLQRKETETCARCHSRRAQIQDDYEPGQSVEQAYRVSLLDEGRYHADGQMLDEVYEYGSFLQSKMYQAGITCSNCHDPHTSKLRKTGNALCAQCHVPAVYDSPKHHFHDGRKGSAECVSCHMSGRTYMEVDTRRDHGFRIPRPDLSVKLGTPNACNQCHSDKTPQWAEKAVRARYGATRQSGWHYAEAIHAGRTSRPDAESQLVRTVKDAHLAPIVRATALSLLPRYLGIDSFPTVERSFKDSDPLVRRAAAAALAVLDPRQRSALGLPLLDDPIRTVRLEAVSNLAALSRDTFTARQYSSLETAMGEYRQTQAYNADRAEAHLNLGALDAMSGRVAQAESEYLLAIRQEPRFIPAYINLADLYRQQGQEGKVEEILKKALIQEADDGDVHEAMGLSLVRRSRLHDAIPILKRAWQLRVDRSRYGYTYAVALHEAGLKAEALSVLKQVHERHRADRDVLAALAQYQQEAGDRKGAVNSARKLVELSPSEEGARRLLNALEKQPS